MNCQQFEKQLDDYLDGTLESEQAHQADAHQRHCARCQDKVRQALALEAELRRLPVPPMRPGFAREAIARATGVEAGAKRSHRRSFVAGFSTALAASVALLAVIALLPGGLQQQPAATPSIAQVAISLEQTQTVNLVFDTPQALEHATLTIALPDNVEVPGLAGQRTITWQTSLQAGRNILPLPLRGISASDGELLASIEQDGKVKTVRVRLTVGSQPHAALRAPRQA